MPRPSGQTRLPIMQLLSVHDASRVLPSVCKGASPDDSDRVFVVNVRTGAVGRRPLRCAQEAE